MFKPGDKVTCIDDSGLFTVEKNKTYIVSDATEEEVLLANNSTYSINRFILAEVRPNTVDEPHITNQITITESAAKNDQEKIDLSLIPKIALEAEARAFMVGEKKYGRYNYCKGHTASQLVAAAMRHLTAWNEGEEYDPKDGQHHLGSVRACTAMILRQIELNTLKDNRFKK